MKRLIITAIITMGIALASHARAFVDGVFADSVSMQRSGPFLAVDMHLDLTGLKVEGNRAVLITPRIENGNNALDLPSVGIYSRRRYYYYLRNRGEDMLSGKEEMSYRASECPDSLEYSKMVPYQDWMNGATLTLLRSDYGCCSKLLAQQDFIIGQHIEEQTTDAMDALEFFPELVYITPVAEAVKSRALEGSAFIDFPVNQTVIYPDYRRNSVELAKIQATIDSVRNDRDVTITQVWLKGFASPEGSYENNSRLAIGRTHALKNYVQQLYHFGDGIITTDYEPEDWDGLRRLVQRSNINHKDEILAVIDSDLQPDTKDLKLKTGWPAEYRFMLQTFYPALRHTDYRIAYNVRSYNNADEIEQVMLTQPQKLSLNELFVVAQKYKPGSDKFTEVFETAVRMYPSDETANLNAANAAMRREDNVAAQRYLDKAGNTPEAVYARGALAIRMGDYETARRYLNEAAELGVMQATSTLIQLDAMQQ